MVELEICKKFVDLTWNDPTVSQECSSYRNQMMLATPLHLMKATDSRFEAEHLEENDSRLDIELSLLAEGDREFDLAADLDRFRI